jgi:hypothetical protein
MSEFAKVWEIFQIFPKYSLFQKTAIIATLPLFIYVLYLLTVGRPPLITYVLTVKPGHLMTATGPLDANGNVTILWSIGNDTKPQAELHNIKAELWTNKRYLVRQSQLGRETTFNNQTTIHYDLELPLLHKNDGGVFLRWEFKPPPVGEEIRLGYNAVASEVDWQWGSWNIVNTGATVALEKYPRQP